MRLSPGTRLGPFEILAPLGAGGMGEVYRARDARLGRDVAVKILPDRVADDPRALARFESEAKAVAALSHPNILALFDVGESNGIRYVVTELVPGQTLRLALREGPLPVRQALEIAGQVAGALDAAHENGIVHRDVKPENVLVGPVGRVKLLDFGLAQGGGGGGGPADDALSTSPGGSRPDAVPGTVAYMSPEQARGGPVDFRSDQFSLGIVLYEMLSGHRPFVRSSAAETMAAIIREEPEPLERLAPAVPAAVRWLVERLLAKEPEDRYASTRDLVQELAALRAHLSRRTSEVARLAEPRTRPALVATAAIALALVVASPLAFLLAKERRRTVPPAGRFEIRTPEGTFLAPHRSAFDLSPDGRLLVFSAFAWKSPYQVPDETRLHVRPLDSLATRALPGTEGGVQPLFSPDGRHVLFAARDEGRSFLRRVPVAGGAVQTVCECDAGFGAAWSDDGAVLFASQYGPLQRVPASGGKPEPATTLDLAAGEVSHRLPHLLPDGRTVLYTSLRWLQTGAGSWKRARIYAGRPGERERVLVVDGGTDGRWAEPGVLLFARDGSLVAAPIDLKRRKLTGPPFPLVDGVRHAIYGGVSALESGAGHFAEAGGVLAWSPGSVDPVVTGTKSWLDESGTESPLEGGPLSGPVSGGRVSADGRRVLLGYTSYPSVQAEVVDLALKSRRRVTVDVNPSWPVWGPGPERFSFSSDHEGKWGIYAQQVDAGPDELECLWKAPDGSYLALGSWSPDGRVLAFLKHAAPGQSDIWLLERGEEPRPFLASRFDEEWPDISPDGLWLLYTSNASGRHEVLVTALSGEGGSRHVSADEGLEPLWSRDGSTIYYWQPVEGRRGISALVRVRVTKRAGALQFGAPERLFERLHLPSAPGHEWDVAPDGRFLVRNPPVESVGRAFWDKVLSDRIVVDTGGVEHLLGDARSRR